MILDAGLRRAAVQHLQASYNQTMAHCQRTVPTAFQQVKDNLASLRIWHKTSKSRMPPPKWQRATYGKPLGTRRESILI